MKLSASGISSANPTKAKQAAGNGQYDAIDFSLRKPSTFSVQLIVLVIVSLLNIIINWELIFIKTTTCP